MSIWEKMGFGGYKGFSHEADRLLRSAVELAGNLGCERQIPAICCWRSCSRIRAQQRGFWQANRSVSRKCAVNWLRPAAPRLCIWTAMTLHRISGVPWTMPSSGRRTLT